MKPISEQMVNAILDGRKGVTRRVINPQPKDCGNGWVEYRKGKSAATWHAPTAHANIGTAPIEEFCQYQPGDLLWVRESFRFGHAPNDESGQGVALYADYRCKYHPDLHPSRYTWCRQWVKKPSIFMPKWASRITLRVTSIRAERLQDITEEDAKAEGVAAWHDTKDGTVYRPEFALLWDKINGKRYPWAANSWVWAIRFEVAEVVHL